MRIENSKGDEISSFDQWAALYDTEKKRVHADTAVMLVHSFSQSHKWFPEYRDFAAKLGVDAELNKIHHVGKRSAVDLYLGWVVGDAEYLER